MTPRAPSDAALGARDPAEAFTPTLFDVARDLRRDVADVRLPLDVPGRDDALASRDRLLDQLDQHLLPRLRELSAPAVVVVAGSTGAGKSTLYNSLLGAEVSAAGVLRPTTRQPVYAHHPADAEVVPDSPATQVSRVVASERVPRGVALLDAPDLDSLEDANRDTAKELLEGADLWLFVTTASRYGDALPWQMLSLATERGASVAMVLNRVPAETLVTIRADLLDRLRAHDMASTPLFVVPDLGPHEGLLGEQVVAPVRRWLTLLAGPERSRSIILRTLQGSLDALPGWVERLADAVEAQVAAAVAIRATVAATAPAVTAAARESVLDGDLAGGSVAARWAQVVHARSSGATVKDGVARSTRRRGRRREAALAGVLDELADALRHALSSASVAADEAVRAALTGPGAPVGGAALAPDAAAPSREADRDADAARRTREWVELGDAEVAALGGVRAEAAVKAYGPHGLAALLLLGAAGVDDASRAAERVLGADATGAVERLRERVGEEAAGVVADRVAATLAAVAGPELDDDAAAVLRLRRAELRRLTRHAKAVRGVAERPGGASHGDAFHGGATGGGAVHGGASHGEGAA